MTTMRTPRRLSDEVMTELENMILAGRFKAGEKLPPERELATRFGVSRPSLREAIQKLVARGLLLSRQGAGLMWQTPSAMLFPIHYWLY